MILISLDIILDLSLIDWTYFISHFCPKDQNKNIALNPQKPQEKKVFDLKRKNFFFDNFISWRK